MNFSSPSLTLIVDRRLYRPQGAGNEPLSLVEAAIEGGITMLQLRISADGGNGGGDDLAVDAIAHKLREMSAGKVPFLVTMDLQLAERCRADGVLLVGDRSYKPTDAKDYLRVRGGTLVGAYADSVPAAARAERGGADFVQVGPAFEEGAADDDSLSLIRKVKDAVHLPLVAFGGIDTLDRAKAAIEAGADGVAVTQAILEADDPRTAASELRAALGT